MSILWARLAQNIMGFIDHNDIRQIQQVKTSKADLKYHRSEQNIQQPSIFKDVVHFITEK